MKGYLLLATNPFPFQGSVGLQIHDPHRWSGSQQGGLCVSGFTLVWQPLLGLQVPPRVSGSFFGH